MLTMCDVMVEKMRREEKRRWAEYGRFVQYATSSNNPHSKRFGAVVGHLLVKWGNEMQARCAAHCGRTPDWQKAFTNL